jgi:hypothetical protein
MHRARLKIYIPNRDECELVSVDHNLVKSFETHNFASGRAIKVNEPENADLIIIFEEWSNKLLSYIDVLNESELFRDYCKKIYTINYDSVANEGFLPGCYVSLSNNKLDSNRYRSCAYPKVYNEHLTAPDKIAITPKFLFCFRGTTHSSPIRKRIVQELTEAREADIVDVTKAFHTHTEQDKTEFLAQMQESIFVLCPRGWSPNSYRLFEAMSVGRCPVIISDEWVETVGPDWSTCSIRVPEADIHNIPKILEERRSEGRLLGQRAQYEWQQHFSEQAKYRAYLDQISELYYSEHPVTKSLDAYNKYWRSKTFLHKNGWTLKQKILRKLRLSN